MKEEVETVQGGCQICGGDVKGSDQFKFYCKKCNILFKREELGVKEESKSEQETASVPYKLPEGVKYIASNHSDKYHKPGCRYIDQIKGAHLKHFKSGIEAERKGYKACICIKR
jgi:hypothetical protein